MLWDHSSEFQFLKELYVAACEHIANNCAGNICNIGSLQQLPNATASP